jgi:hypothetical protein
MSGWTVVDTASNKSLPVGGTQNSGTGVPYIAPVPSATDPVQKLRISAPQSLIDTDFEYGTQPTKWESVGLQNNRQSTYFFAQQPRAITSIIAATNIVTVLMADTGGFAVGTPVYVQNSLDPLLNGWWLVSEVNANVSIKYVITTNTATTTNQYSATGTSLYLGYFFSKCGIQLTGTTALTFVGSTVTVTTTGAHGLNKGSLIYVVSTTGPSAATTVNAAQIVATVPTYNTFTFTNVNGTPSTTIANTAGNSNIFSRPSGYVEPRSFDGGVAFSAGSSVPNQQLIRQTRRYFRYQSGKGLQFSTGSSLKPALFVSSIVNASGTVSVTCRFNHNLTVGTTVQILGANQGFFNGTYTVASITSPTIFTYTIATSNTVTATGQFRVTPLTWFGANSRIGMFDQQNGMFFEYDGATLYAVLRNSTNQISGTVTATINSAEITGVGTAFLSQLQPGNFIVIRGQSYRVVQIVSDTVLSISPEYRGTTTIANCIVSQTIDLRFPQSQWNIDRCDGTGPSGYNIDLTRMQMWYIDYSWYGAGFIRYGVRGTNGQITYVHQIQNNNRQYEAYMRSGNMAAHYEVSGIPPISYLTAPLGSASTTITADITGLQTTIPVGQTSRFNQSGGVAAIGSPVEYIFYGSTSTTSGAGNLLNCVRGFGNTKADDQASGSSIGPSSFTIASAAGFPTPAQTPATLTVEVTEANGNIEYINYTNITSSGIVWGLTRAQTGGQATAQAFANGDVRTAVEFVAPATVPALSHWGSSAIMDGRFDDDKSLIFNYGTNLLTTTTSITALTPILAIRIAPAVDNGQIGLMGNKEIINRMQLQLFELGLITDGPVLVNLILNGITTGTYSGSFISPVTLGLATGAYTSSLAQVAQNTTNTVTLVGGESVAAAFTNTTGQTTLDLTGVRDLGNSILGGGTTNTLPTTQQGVYPDGPDILYVCVAPLTARATTVYGRLSWKEAQA